ncbi:hypothetical protein PT974_07313 [Cladobotryum mycophilum]|uniref:Uncharacterized protein n=1 Tax=Cladobotryum mycophilum TaxID=491253 RepID=A0ABR0SQ76_9HYPO
MIPFSEAVYENVDLISTRISSTEAEHALNFISCSKRPIFGTVSIADALTATSTSSIGSKSLELMRQPDS